MADKASLEALEWDLFDRLTPLEMIPYLMLGTRPNHVLVAQQFSRKSLEEFSRIATRIRKISKTRAGLNFLRKRLSDKRAMLYFAQPSSRTFLSFCSACQILGLQLAEVRDTSTSSEMKGESADDTVRTFSSYMDIIIMRHPVGGFAKRTAWLLSNIHRTVPVINAGSGKDQHPTQALLDIYTLGLSFQEQGGIDGKKVMFVGDLARGRTVRSLAWLLTLYRDVTLYFVAPEELQIGPDVLEQLDAAGVAYEQSNEINEFLPRADAVYMTRIQDEWDGDGENTTLRGSEFSLNRENIHLLKDDGIVMHPFPRRQEIDVAIDSDPRAVYWRQMRNGMWIRAALLIIMFGREAELDEFKE